MKICKLLYDYDVGVLARVWLRHLNVRPKFEKLTKYPPLLTCLVMKLKSTGGFKQPEWSSYAIDGEKDWSLVA